MSAREVIVSFRGILEASGTIEWVSESLLEITLAKPVDFGVIRSLESGGLFPAFKEPSLQNQYDRGSTGRVEAGAVIRFEVPRTTEGIIVAKNLDDLLKVEGTQVREPSGYVIVPTRGQGRLVSHVAGDDADGAAPEIRRYHDAIRFWEILRQQAQHEDESTGALLFFGIHRVEILPGFGPGELRQDIAIAKIGGFVSDPDRRETRKEIFISQLSEFLRDQKPSSSFATLLRDSERFAQRLREGMAIYLFEHSPERLAEEAKTSALSLSERLEKIIGGLETKSLSIPVALLLAVKEIAPGAGFTSLNGIVAISALTYAVTMTLVHFSQLAVLRLLRTTIVNTVAEYRRKGLDEDNQVLTTTYDTLRSRSTGAKVGSYVMCLASWAPFVCVVGQILWGTPTAGLHSP